MTEKGIQRFYQTILPDHIYPPVNEDVFTREDCYFRIWISEMYLENSRNLYKDYSPMINAFCRFRFQNKEHEIPIIVGSNKIPGFKGDLKNVIHLNYKLLGPIKYEGGNFEIVIGLFAFASKDYGKEFINLLSDISQLACQGELQIGLNYFHTLKGSIESILGIEDIKPIIGLHDSFSVSINSPNKFRPFYGVVINSEEEKIDINKLWVKDGRLLMGDNFENAKPFKEKDYFLFYIERLNQHDDIKSISSVYNAWKNAETIIQVKGLDEKGINAGIESLINSIIWISDITRADKMLLIGSFKEYFEKKYEILREVPQYQLVFPQIPSERTVDSMITDPSKIKHDIIDINSVVANYSLPLEKAKNIQYTDLNQFLI